MASTEPAGDGDQEAGPPPTLVDVLNWLIDATIVLVVVGLVAATALYFRPPKPLTAKQIAAQRELEIRLVCTGGVAWGPSDEQIKSGVCNKYRDPGRATR
jgi:hypothetical protein